MTSGKRTLSLGIVCGILVGLAGCQYIKPIAVVLSLLTSRQERVVRVEVTVPEATGEPGAPIAAPTTGK